jgi:hypothetical protein
MKKILLMVAIAFSIASCQETKTVPPFKKKRVIVLETNTISYVHIPIGLDSIYRNEDTVWVNLITHQIDDCDSFTMMSVIKP